MDLAVTTIVFLPHSPRKRRITIAITRALTLVRVLDEYYQVTKKVLKL